MNSFVDITIEPVGLIQKRFDCLRQRAIGAYRKINKFKDYTAEEVVYTGVHPAVEEWLGCTCQGVDGKPVLLRAVRREGDDAAVAERRWQVDVDVDDVESTI